MNITASPIHFPAPIRRLWSLLIEPASSTPPQLISRARLQAVLIVLFIPALVISLSVPWFGESYREFIFIGIIIQIIGYLLNRFGRYYLAAFIGLSFLTLNPYFMFYSWNRFTMTMVTMAFLWASVAIFTSYVVLRLRGTLITVLINLGMLLLLPLIEPQLSFNQLTYVLAFNLVVSGLVIAAAFLRQIESNHTHALALAREESDERYRALFDATFEGVVLSADGIVLDANPAFEAMTLFSLEELRGMQVSSLYTTPSEDLEMFHQQWGPYEVPGARKDGSTYWGEVRAKVVQYRGKPVRAAVIRDITERKLAEEQKIDLAIEREKVNILKRFIGNLSHDLRTPLSVIKTSVYLLDRVSDPEKRHKHLEALDHEADRLQQMLDDLLSMSRLDKADTSEYRLTIGYINPLIDTVLLEQQSLALQKKIILNADLAPDLAPMVFDTNEFRRMLKHLIQNGINYSPENGQVTVRTYNQNEHIMVEISDTGSGIDPLDLPYIFERFYRGDTARSKTGGTGLGLSIARKIAEAHSGKITVESKIGQGTTFRITFPPVQEGYKLPVVLRD